MRSSILIFEQMQAATTIARSLYALATVDSLDNALGIQAAVASASHLVVDAELIELLMNCSVLSWNCPITKEYSPRLIDIADGKMRGNVDLSPDRRLQYLTQSNGQFSAVPQVQILREMLASVTASPKQIR